MTDTAGVCGPGGGWPARDRAGPTSPAPPVEKPSLGASLCPQSLPLLLQLPQMCPPGSSPPHTPQASFSAHQPASALPFPLQTEDLGTSVQLVGGSPPIFILGRVLLKTKGAVGQPHRVGPSSRAKPSGPPAPALVFPYLPGSLMLSPACRSFSRLLL